MEPIVIFLARCSGCHNGQTAEATREFLLRSLQFTRQAYEKTYGKLSQEPSFLPFIQSSEAFKPKGHMVIQLLDILNSARETGRSVIMVVNGWDGIFTNPVVFANLFRPYFDIEVTLRFYVDEPRVFKEADARAAVQLLDREIEDADETPFDTAKFVKMIQAISFIKQGLSELKLQLFQASHKRNTPPDLHFDENEPPKYPCDKCDASFYRSDDLHVHKKHTHHDQPVEVRTCQYCGKVLTRKDARVRHERNDCRLRPGYVPPERAPPAPRGVKRSFPSGGGSTNGFAPYAEIEERSDQWPVINAENPMTYRGEVFCRAPGCQRKARFPDPSTLSRHLKKVHKLNMPTRKHGTLTEREQWFHDAGLEWLARCAYFGKDKVDDEPPVPPRP